MWRRQEDLAMPDDKVLRDIDAYVERLCSVNDPVLEQALKDADAAGLPQINVSPSEGKLICLLAKMSRARRILEIGTLGGYSTIWLARALPPDGKLISLELNEKHASVARKNVERAGFSGKVEIRIGAAAESLDRMIAAAEAPFDLVFVDADKRSYPAYLERVLKLVQPGSVILGDNCLRRVVLEVADDADARGIRKFNEMLASDARLETIIIPIVRHSIDGLAIARVK
jgi:caffeoyl-CoA O-methyltransferase